MESHEVVTVKPEPAATETSIEYASRSVQGPKVVVLADLNVNPPETDDHDSVHLSAPELTRLTSEDSSQDKSNVMSKEIDTAEGDSKKVNKVGKCRSRTNKVDSSLDNGVDVDGDQPGQGAPSSREEKVSSLKTYLAAWFSFISGGRVLLLHKHIPSKLQGLVHVARKMPKNGHAHFILGLMYQRLSQPQKAIPEYEKAAEILLRCEADIARPELLSLVQIHHAQCLLLEGIEDTGSDRELEPEEIEEILSKMKDSMQSDIRQAAVWNTLGAILLKTGRLQSAISVLSSLLTVVPDNHDCLGNLGIAYLQSGNLELSTKCFQELILKDQNHPAALINYAAVLLCKYGSHVAGAGASASEGASANQVEAINVARDCFLAALKADPRAAHLWANLANAYYLIGDHRSSSKCLEKAARLEPNCLSTRYAVAVHRIKDVERSQDPSEQISLAGNEMASILREGDTVPIESPIAWAGLAMVHKAQHEIAAAFETEHNELMEMEERATNSLKQALAEDPDDAVQWHQLGLHSLFSQQYKASQKYLKAAVARFKECSYAWSNLGISLQLSEEPSQAENVHKRALALATSDQAHAIFSNLGNLYRQQRQYERAKAMFTKSLELQPGYAPAFNNLGLVFVAEGLWEEAKYCFDKALQADPLLDVAKSNMMKAISMSRLCGSMSSCLLQD